MSSPLVYSVDLTVWLRFEGTKIPQVVRECVHAVEDKGIHSTLLHALLDI